MQVIRTVQVLFDLIDLSAKLLFSLVRQACKSVLKRFFCNLHLLMSLSKQVCISKLALTCSPVWPGLFVEIEQHTIYLDSCIFKKIPAQQTGARNKSSSIRISQLPSFDYFSFINNYGNKKPCFLPSQKMWICQRIAFLVETWKVDFIVTSDSLKLSFAEIFLPFRQTLGF